MTILNPPAWLQQETYSARRDRLVLSGYITQGGASSPTAFAVTATSTPSMAVVVSAGDAFIVGNTIAGQGVYHVFNDGPVTISVPDSSTTASRTDVVVVHVYDADVSGSLNLADIEIISGSPGGAVPVIPENSIEIARITVAMNATVISPGAISTAFRQQARLNPSMSGSNLIVTSSTRPSSPIQGQQIFESDTKRVLVWDGTEWDRILSGVTQPVTMTLQTGYGDYGVITGLTSQFGLPKYHKRDDMVHIEGGWVGRTTTASVTAGTNYTTVFNALPAGFRPEKTLGFLGTFNNAGVLAYCHWRIQQNGVIMWTPMASGLMSTNGATFLVFPPVDYLAVN